MKKTDNGIKLEFTLEEVKAFRIALPLLEEISDILDETDGAIFDKTTGTVILNYSDVSGIDLLKRVLLDEDEVTIIPES